MKMSKCEVSPSRVLPVLVIYFDPTPFHPPSRHHPHFTPNSRLIMDALPRNASPESPQAVIPPPWVFKTKLYLFAAPLNLVDRENPLLQGLPPGSYNPEETIHPSALAPVKGSPQWKGGMLKVVIVRYEDSPIGPYDELIASLDGYANPFEKGTSARITNIYVDSRKSIWHGRKNWSVSLWPIILTFMSTDNR
jgi:hypothetical protein